MSSRVVHRQSIDLARFLAAFGVVAAHAYAMEQDWIGHLALGLFLILTGFLAVQSMERAGGRYPFIARAKRLLLPWLVWCLFYRVVDLRVSDDPDKWQLLTNPWSLLVGPAIHLWFLPFVMLAMVLVEPAGRIITTPKRLAAALVGLVAISVPLSGLHQSTGLPEPLPQWFFALPVYSLGLMFGFGHSMNRAWWPLCAAAVISALAYVVTGGAIWSAMILLAAVLFEIFWRLPLHHRWLPLLGQASFGIYLLHPFFMLVTYKLFGGGVDRAFAAVLTFSMTLIVVLVLRQVSAIARLM